MEYTEIITSRKNPVIQQVRRLLVSRKEREAAGLFVSDGTKLLQEAAKHFPGLDTVLLTPETEVQLPASVRVLRVSREIMDYISPMETPQGALFLCRLPEQAPFSPEPGMLLLDGIQDPGNLGTVLRTADALGVRVVLLEGCADPFSHKTVRASMGAVFRSLPVKSTWAEASQALKSAGIPVAVTALRADATDIRATPVGQMAVVIGSEGQGVRQEILNAADKTVIIPMTAHCESLNAAVAATVVMWEMEKF